MAFGQNPGALFIGTLFPDDKAFVASVLKAAKENGYTKVVEPCSGQLAMSCIAADLGYEDIEASDITIFSGVLGRYVEGRPIDDMGIKYVETGESPQSAAEVMYEIKHRELLNAAGSVYGDAMLVDFESRKDSILASIHNDMDALKERIPNLTYRDMDMFDHIEAVKDIPGTVILCMCPTYCLHVDEKDTLVKIAALITDVDDMLESALDKDFFEKVEREAASMPVPKIDFEWKTVQFTFLSHQMEDLKKLCDKCASADWEGVADIAQFDRFVEALNQTKKFGDVKNIGSAIHFMTERTLKDFGEDGRDYRTAASVFGKGLIPQHVADKLEAKIKSLTEEGRIRNPWEVFDILFDEEGDGDA